MRFSSKLPDVGTTIFTVMSRRAVEEGALNIGQGFPDYPIDPRLAAALVEVIGEGHNQYAPMEGVVELRERISAKLQTSYGRRFDPHSEITVTCGGTEALFDAIQAAVAPGDEAIIFDPAYDAYEPAVRLAGGRCVRIALAPPAFRFDWDEVRAGFDRPHPLDHHQQPAESELHGGGARRLGCARRLDPRSADHRARR